MQHHWLNKQNNNKLIIFFGGWSFDHKPFEFLECGDFDVLMFFDYSKISLEAEIGKYDEVHLICWSMGVFAAYLLKDELLKLSGTLAKKIAINGTPFPVHNDWGIPKKTFELTLKYIDSGLRGKFYKNVFKTEEEFNRYMSTPVERSLENRASELCSLDEIIKTTATGYDNFYNLAIVSESDKIVPAKNQLAFWSSHTPTKTLESGHFPFYNFKSWEEILEISTSMKD